LIDLKPSKEVLCRNHERYLTFSVRSRHPYSCVEGVQSPNQVSTENTAKHHFRFCSTYPVRPCRFIHRSLTGSQPTKFYCYRNSWRTRIRIASYGTLVAYPIAYRNQKAIPKLAIFCAIQQEKRALELGIFLNDQSTYSKIKSTWKNSKIQQSCRSGQSFQTQARYY
jgi:hypothetical protein